MAGGGITKVGVLGGAYGGSVDENVLEKMEIMKQAIRFLSNVGQSDLRM